MFEMSASGLILMLHNEGALAMSCLDQQACRPLSGEVDSRAARPCQTMSLESEVAHANASGLAGLAVKITHDPVLRQ